MLHWSQQCQTGVDPGEGGCSRVVGGGTVLQKLKLFHMFQD